MLNFEIFSNQEIRTVFKHTKVIQHQEKRKKFYPNAIINILLKELSYLINNRNKLRIQLKRYV